MRFERRWSGLRGKRGIPGSLILLVVAVAMGIVAAWLTQQKISEAQTTGTVVVAATKIEAYSKLDKTNLKLGEMPVSAIPSDAIRNIGDVEGKFTSVGLLPGEVVRKEELIPQGDRVSVQLAVEAPESVAMVIPLQPEQGAGLPKEGDYIDLLGVQQSQGGIVAETFPGVRVLAVQTSSGNSGPGSSSSSDSGPVRLVVEVRAQDEEKIAKFLAVGDLRIAVRPLSWGGE